jgi:peptidoglycan/xylan/chitin deacetylase (PgdA/CDA1 family)
MASGEPAVVQHTGPSSFLPDTPGLFRFRDAEDAVDCLETVAADYERQCRLSRQLAEEHFDARRIVGRVLERALAQESVRRRAEEEALISIRPTERRLAILSFRKVGPPSPGSWDTWYYIPASDFAGYLQHLHENDWQVIDLPTLLQDPAAPNRLPERAALLTFGDGYHSTLNVALPLLLWFGYPALVFVPTDCVGAGSHSFDVNCRAPDVPLCDWDELGELERCGVSIQCHGATHRVFSALTLTEQEEELLRSKTVLEAKLEKRVEVFCFPYGDNGTNPEGVGRILKRVGYKAACLYDGLINRLPISDPYSLSRLTIGCGTDLQAELERR